IKQKKLVYLSKLLILHHHFILILIMSYKKTFSRFFKVAHSMIKATQRMTTFIHQTDNGSTINNKWLYSTEVMEMLQISESTLRRMRKKGEIPCEKIGGTYR